MVEEKAEHDCRYLTVILHSTTIIFNSIEAKFKENLVKLLLNLLELNKLSRL